MGLVSKKLGRPPKPIAIRFWAKVCKMANGCWLFESNKGGGKYGMLSVPKGEEYLAHRISWTLHNGPIPNGLKVLHRCDVPKCVNPSHLFLGTTKDNSDDKVSKRRHPFGEDAGMAKLTEFDVLEIRRLYATGKFSQQSLADRFGINQTNVGFIVRRVHWKHI